MKLVESLQDYDQLMEIAESSAISALKNLQLNNQNPASTGGRCAYLYYFITS